MKDAVKTTAGETFSYEEHCDLALLVWRRWGRNMAAAAVAWRRLFQNNCPDFDFECMVDAAIRRQPEEIAAKREIVQSALCCHGKWRERCLSCAVAEGEHA